MNIRINDDFDLQKISASGQCFRVKTFEDNTYRFITGNHILYIRADSPKEYSVSCTAAEWNDIWFSYFDLDRNYQSIRNQIPDNDDFLKKAAAVGSGIRILRQEHFETLISFIISQRKSIPAIRQSIELLSHRYGLPVRTQYETVYTFPEPEALANITPDELKACKVGYRAGYIQDTVSRILAKDISLALLENESDERLLDALMNLKGVGIKVANCVSLFSYGRTSLAPVDTWINKVIHMRYNDVNPFPQFGENAGILQQYIFYYALQHKNELS